MKLASLRPSHPAEVYVRQFRYVRSSARLDGCLEAIQSLVLMNRISEVRSSCSVSQVLPGI